MSAVQVSATLTASEPAGAYQLLTLEAPEVAATAEPGHFVALAVGGPGTSMLLRRSFALYTADRASGRIQVVIAEHGPGTAWLVRAPVGTELDVVGPLGRPFPLPPAEAGGTAVLVAGGYGSAPLFDLARTLRQRTVAVHLVLGAATRARLFGLSEASELADSVTVTTDDGSAGRRGLVTYGLAELIGRTAADVVYACGPMAMLQAVGELAGACGVQCHVAVEEAMACGIGVCMTCVLPVVGADGVSRLVRSCTEGPVFDAARVRWKDVGTLPADVYGADAMGGSR